MLTYVSKPSGRGWRRVAQHRVRMEPPKPPPVGGAGRLDNVLIQEDGPLTSEDVETRKVVFCIPKQRASIIPALVECPLYDTLCRSHQSWFVP